MLASKPVRQPVIMAAVSATRLVLGSGSRRHRVSRLAAGWPTYLPTTAPAPPLAAALPPPKGVMGGAVADTLLRGGYQVSAWTRTPRSHTNRPGGGVLRCHHGPDQLRAFAEGVDVLVCLLPLTDATR